MSTRLAEQHFHISRSRHEVARSDHETRPGRGNPGPPRTPANRPVGVILGKRHFREDQGSSFRRELRAWSKSGPGRQINRETTPGHSRKCDLVMVWCGREWCGAVGTGESACRVREMVIAKSTRPTASRRTRTTWRAWSGLVGAVGPVGLTSKPCGPRTAVSTGPQAPHRGLAPRRTTGRETAEPRVSAGPGSARVGYPAGGVVADSGRHFPDDVEGPCHLVTRRRSG